MKNKIVLLPFFAVLVFILSLGAVSAIDISVDNYYPAPVEAGEYLNVWLKVSNYDKTNVEAAVVRLKPSFPFSFDPGEEKEVIVRNIKAGGFTIVKMKVRVDAGAKEGDNSLAFQYADTIGGQWKEKSIPITIIESQTTFDVVLQELNEEGVFIAIANIGKNSANAVTVRIPEQEHFRTQTVSASIVGNLASGDYTLVGFSILPKTDNVQVGASETTPQEEGQQRRQQTLSEEPENLMVQIDYTDPLGVRRTIIKEIPLNPSSLTLMSAGTSGTGTTFARTGTAQNSTLSTLLSNTWFWVSMALIVLMIGSKVYRRIKKRKD